MERHGDQRGRGCVHVHMWVYTLVCMGTVEGKRVGPGMAAGVVLQMGACVTWVQPWSEPGSEMALASTLGVACRSTTVDKRSD